MCVQMRCACQIVCLKGQCKPLVGVEKINLLGFRIGGRTFSILAQKRLQITDDCSSACVDVGG